MEAAPSHLSDAKGEWLKAAVLGVCVEVVGAFGSSFGATALRKRRRWPRLAGIGEQQMGGEVQQEVSVPTSQQNVELAVPVKYVILIRKYLREAEMSGFEPPDARLNESTCALESTILR